MFYKGAMQILKTILHVVNRSKVLILHQTANFNALNPHFCSKWVHFYQGWFYVEINNVSGIMKSGGVNYEIISC